MHYCKVILKQLPVLAFAHTYESAHYNLVIPECEDFLEISFTEQGDVNVWEEDKVAYQCPEHTLSTVYNKKTLRFDTEAPWHRHTTIGFSAEYEMQPLSKEEVIAYSRENDISGNERELYAILPMEGGMELPERSKILDIMRGIIRSYPNISAPNRLLLSSQVIKLLSEITQECIRQSLMTEEITPGNLLCVQRAMRYVSENIQRKIKVEEVAEVVKLSPGYLGTIFKTVVGQTLKEYINRTKLQVVKELVLSGKMSFVEAGEYVGIQDTNYLSRLFRKYMDTTIQELKKEP